NYYQPSLAVPHILPSVSFLLFHVLIGRYQRLPFCVYPIHRCPSCFANSSYRIGHFGYAQPPSGADKNGLPSRLIIRLWPTTNVPFSGMYKVPCLFFFHLLPDGFGLLAGLDGAGLDATTPPPC